MGVKAKFLDHAMRSLVLLLVLAFATLLSEHKCPSPVRTEYPTAGNAVDAVEKLHIADEFQTPCVFSAPFTTRLATVEELLATESQEILNALGQSNRLHRKQWEFVFIIKALREKEMLKPGKRALVFAAGTEPLISYFANEGVHVTATDMDASGAVDAGWATTNQHAASKESLYISDLIDRDKFDRLVQYRTLDMNDLKTDLFNQFDFIWSTCSLEHVGSILLGQRFALDSMRLLKPGGLAVHTTEFTLSSLRETIRLGPTVLWTLRDVEEMLASATILKYRLWDRCLYAGGHEIDQTPDLPPYKDEEHMKLELGGHILTSVGWVMEK